MAMPPTPAPAGPPPGAPAAPPDMGAAPPDDMGDETGDDTGADEGGEDTVIATICRTSDGKLKLYSGDEPEEDEGDEGGAPSPGGMPPGGPGEPAGGEEAAPEAQTFDTPQALIRALIPMLDEGTKGAEAAFAGVPSRTGGMAAKPPMGGM